MHACMGFESSLSWQLIMISLHVKHIIEQEQDAHHENA